MFLRPFKVNAAPIRVKLLTADDALGTRLKQGFAPEQRYKLEVSRNSAIEAAALPNVCADCTVLVIDVDSRNAQEATSLETITGAAGGQAPVIVMSDDLGSAAVRRLLHLQIADWLPRQASPTDLQLACERATRAKETNGRARTAKCIAFYPVLGGVGNTTLTMASAFILARGRRQANSVCLIDLDLQSGTMADYLDLPPNLQLEDIAKTPERLDGQLLEVLLSRHASGIGLLAAPNSMNGLQVVGPDLIARLLDNAAAKFSNLVIDLPRQWLPWSESVLKGSDHFFVVTDLSVPGLRKARRIADELHRQFGAPLKGRVIVNKVGWLGNHGVKKNDAYEALGERLAGFVADGGSIVAQAHNRGVPLSELKRSSRLEKDLGTIVGP